MGTGLEDPAVFSSNEDQVNALKAILGFGGGAMALGAGARGLAGLGSFFDRNLSGPPRTPLRQSFVRIPVPVKVRTPEERDAILAANELDTEKEAGLAKLAEDAWWTAADYLGMLRRPGQIANAAQNAIGGWGMPGLWQKPWAMPAAATAATGGLYGGWKLTDYLLDKTKNMEQESELEAARKDYEAALASRRKTASAEVTPLDTLADLYEKQALLPEVKGLGLLAGLGIAGISGLGAYNWTRSLAEDKAVEEAVRKRQAQIAEQAPSPIMAIPTPEPVLRPQRSHWQHVQHLLGHDHHDKEKTANIGQAADNFLGRIRSNQMAVWQRLMTPPDAKPAKPAKPEEPAPPQLPSLAGSMGRMAGQATVTR